jgi:hypothetical protein
MKKIAQRISTPDYSKKEKLLDIYNRRLSLLQRQFSQAQDNQQTPPNYLRVEIDTTEQQIQALEKELENRPN